MFYLFLTRIILNELFTKMPFKQLASKKDQNSDGVYIHFLYNVNGSLRPNKNVCTVTCQTNLGSVGRH